MRTSKPSERVVEILENQEQWSETFRSGWLAHLERTGSYDFKLYKQVINKTVPAGAGVDLSKSRLMFITTSGAHLAAHQDNFDVTHPVGDYSIRTFPTSTAFDALAFGHDHYDHSAVEQDPQVLMPQRYLEEMVAAGAIGELAPSVVSFMGYQPDAARVVDELIPEILRVAKEEHAQAALLVPA